MVNKSFLSLEDNVNSDRISNCSSFVTNLLTRLPCVLRIDHFVFAISFSSSSSSSSCNTFNIITTSKFDDQTERPSSKYKCIKFCDGVRVMNTVRHVFELTGNNSWERAEKSFICSLKSLKQNNISSKSKDLWNGSWNETRTTEKGNFKIIPF